MEATTQLIPGKCMSIGQGVRRMVARNAGLMTGPGTNTYLIVAAAGAVYDDDGRWRPAGP